jgi:hypothetical protein
MPREAVDVHIQVCRSQQEEYDREVLGSVQTGEISIAQYHDEASREPWKWKRFQVEFLHPQERLLAFEDDHCGPFSITQLLRSIDWKTYMSASMFIPLLTNAADPLSPFPESSASCSF